MFNTLRDKNIKNLVVILVVITFVIGFIIIISGGGGSNQGQGGSSEIAKIQGRSVYLQDIRSYYEAIKAKYEGQIIKIILRIWKRKFY